MESFASLLYGDRMMNELLYVRALNSGQNYSYVYFCLSSFVGSEKYIYFMENMDAGDICILCVAAQWTRIIESETHYK